MNRKKLLQINCVINSGSTGRIAEEIGQLAINNGCKSYIAYGRNERVSQSERIKIGNDWDLKWHGLQTRLFDRHGLASAKATKKLVEKIKEIQPDIIHLHNLHGYYLNIDILFHFLATVNIPVVWTLHDCWPMTGHCSHFSFAGCYKWKTQCEHCPQKKEYPASYLIDRSSKNYQLKKELFTSIPKMTLVPVSNWLADIVKDSFLKSYPIKIIYNGVDTTVFSPCAITETRQKYKIPENTFIMLGVASIWSERKGLKDFIRLSELLTDNEMIVLVGLTNQQIKSLPSNILGIKRTENVYELAELYSMADVVCNFSVEETFGLTTVEGFACSTPGIVYNCTASPELITSETGFVVEQGDLIGIRDIINTIKSKGKAFYAEACRERAVKMFNKKEHYGEYLDLYQQLLLGK
jgi:glycosyltransferase involved in cell wall biosynthesis